ncbi:hypothetical protein [Chryseobacterium arthrosphaerae]|uniref:hypothetical protein n=1 Tax=Chryseobacterium arthrosphaerae TaxID=651561 RepID=UPI00241F7D76|nr:hypothetical protein [Chryseobacterium arthrosphaerae]
MTLAAAKRLYFIAQKRDACASEGEMLAQAEGNNIAQSVIHFIFFKNIIEKYIVNTKPLHFARVFMLSTTRYNRAGAGSYSYLLKVTNFAVPEDNRLKINIILCIINNIKPTMEF